MTSATRPGRGHAAAARRRSGYPRRRARAADRPGALLTPAGRARPARYRDYLPADPGLRGTTIDGAVTGMTAADFDAPSRRLLRRAQDAVDAVTSAQVFRAGLLDRAATGLALAGQEWNIAVALREQALCSRTCPQPPSS